MNVAPKSWKLPSVPRQASAPAARRKAGTDGWDLGRGDGQDSEGQGCRILFGDTFGGVGGFLGDV